jgi:hypothetical protein
MGLQMGTPPKSICKSESRNHAWAHELTTISGQGKIPLRLEFGNIEKSSGEFW